ncbi:hypothetical protein AYI68_g5955 [Smittium mucronatum]|uniref:Uncharacterized protein n=1 Tax=Smittium mucronatum TaxID=133383 RepID=A0A1R0GSU1_9FUNG|nr:hypothetical protein AYI68_g5955 [Smittium mucronatum]
MDQDDDIPVVRRATKGKIKSRSADVLVEKSEIHNKPTNEEILASKLNAKTPDTIKSDSLNSNSPRNAQISTMDNKLLLEKNFDLKVHAQNSSSLGSRDLKKRPKIKKSASTSTESQLSADKNSAIKSTKMVHSVNHPSNSMVDSKPIPSLKRPFEDGEAQSIKKKKSSVSKKADPILTDSRGGTRKGAERKSFSNDNPFQSGPDSAKKPTKRRSTKSKSKKQTKSNPDLNSSHSLSPVQNKVTSISESKSHILQEIQNKIEIHTGENIIDSQKSNTSYNVFDVISPPKITQSVSNINQYQNNPIPANANSLQSPSNLPMPSSILNEFPDLTRSKNPLLTSPGIQSSLETNFSSSRSELNEPINISANSLNRTPSNPPRTLMNPTYSQSYLRSAQREPLRANNWYLQTPRVKELIEYYERTGNSEALELLYAQSSLLVDRQSEQRLLNSRRSTITPDPRIQNNDISYRSNSMLRNRRHNLSEDLDVRDYESPSNTKNASRNNQDNLLDFDPQSSNSNTSTNRIPFIPEVSHVFRDKGSETLKTNTLSKIGVLKHIKRFYQSRIIVSIASGLLFVLVMFVYCNYLKFKIGFINTRFGAPILEPDNYEFGDNSNRYQFRDRYKLSEMMERGLKFSDIVYKIDTLLIDHVLGRNERGLLCPKHATCTTYIPIPYKNVVQNYNLAGKQQIFLSIDKRSGYEAGQTIMKCDSGYVLVNSGISSRIFPVLPFCKADLDTIIKVGRLVNAISQHLATYRGTVECSEPILDQIERMVAIRRENNKISPDKRHKHNYETVSVDGTGGTSEGDVQTTLEELKLATDAQKYGINNESIYLKMAGKVSSKEFEHLYSLAIKNIADGNGNVIAVRVEYDQVPDTQDKKELKAARNVSGAIHAVDSV